WEPLPVLRQEVLNDRAVAGPRCAAQPGREEHVGQYCVRVPEVQHQEGRAHADAGPYDADRRSQAAAPKPGHQPQAERGAVRELEAVPRPRLLERRTQVTPTKGRADWPAFFP